MAWDFGCGDIVAGIRIALTIYEYGFVEENAADYRYREFRNDILNFYHLLQLLERSLKDAQRRYLDGGFIAAAEGAYDPLAEDFEAERMVIVGNFKDTLRDCAAFLDENKKFRARYATVMESLKWHFFEQQEVRMEDLRRRLQFHSLKMRLVIDRLSISLLTDIDSKLDVILAITSENLQLSRDTLDEIRLLRHLLFGGDPSKRPPITQSLLDVAPDLALRFGNALEVNDPRTYGSELPLVEAFDALWHRFGESVQGPHSPERHLQLLKCCWLLEQIKSSPAYNEASPAFYYRRAVNQVEIALRARIRRLAATEPYDLSALLTLPDDMFEIWIPPPRPQPAAIIPQQPNPILIQGGERQLASIQLANDGQQVPDVVHVFQVGDENYRIALETSTSSGQKYIREQPLYTREHRFIPRYALPTMPDPVPEVAIFSHGRYHLYHFQNYQDLWQFQAAFTGYEVPHDQPGVRCQFGPNLDSFVCDSRIQFWQEPIEFNTLPAMSQTATVPTQDRKEKAPSSLRSRQASLAPSLGQTTNFTATPDALIAETVKYSALVIYTQFTHLKNDSRFATIFLELRDNIYIDREACACKHGYDGCSKLVIAAKKKARLPLRMVFSTDVSGQQDPNTFDVLPLRLPRRPDYGAIKIRESEHIVLKFQSLDAKKLFDDELQTRFAVRDKQREHMAAIERRFLHMANHPQRRDQYRPQRDSGRQPTTVFATPTVSIPEPAPRLAQPEMGPPLGINFANSAAPRQRQGLAANHEASSLSTSPLSNESSLGSASAGSRTNSTPSTDWDHHHETSKSPLSMTSQMTALLNSYSINSNNAPPRANPPTSPRPITRTPSVPVPVRSPYGQNATSSSPPVPWPASPHTNADISAAGMLGRRDTATTFKSTKTVSSGSTAQTAERQEVNRRDSSRSSGGRSVGGFFKHMVGNR